MKNDTVTIKFKMSSEIDKKEQEKLLYDIIQEIQDRVMYVTEVNINDVKFFEFDDSKFINGGTKE